MTAETASPMNGKVKDRIEGYHVKILDDGSYLLCEEHSQYDKRKESSHETYDSLMAAMHKSMKGKMKGKDKDELSEKY